MPDRCGLVRGRYRIRGSRRRPSLSCGGAQAIDGFFGIALDEAGVTGGGGGGEGVAAGGLDIEGFVVWGGRHERLGDLRGPGMIAAAGQRRASERFAAPSPWARWPALCRSAGTRGTPRRPRLCRPSEGRRSHRNRASGRARACFRSRPDRLGPFPENLEGLLVKRPRGLGVSPHRKTHGPLMVVRQGEIVLCRPGIGTFRRDLFADRSASVDRALAFSQIAHPHGQCRELRVVARELAAAFPVVGLGRRERLADRDFFADRARVPFRDDRAPFPSPRACPANWPAHSCNVVVGLLREAGPADLDCPAKVLLGPLGVAQSVHRDVAELALGLQEQLTCRSRSSGSAAASLAMISSALPELLHRARELVARQAHTGLRLVGPGQRPPVGLLVLGVPVDVAAQVGHRLGRGLESLDRLVERLLAHRSGSRARPAACHLAG